MNIGFAYITFLIAWIVIFPQDEVFSQQNKGKTFLAEELHSVSEEYTSDPEAWPILISLAVHQKSSNKFYLSNFAIQRLHRFGFQHKHVLNAKTKMNALIKTGATLFAASELNVAKHNLSRYEKNIKSGILDSAMVYGKSFLSDIVIVEKALNKNRLESITAKLEELVGDAKKRLGLLGAWVQAFVGDLFKESDAIKTYDKSSAVLLFIDGSYITVEENSTAIVRKAVLDKLNKSVETDIMLLNGNLLAKLSQKARNDGGFQVSTTHSHISVNSGKFWTSSLKKRSRIANYDGVVKVKSGNVQVTLKKNQGTVVAEGKKPLPPVELLPAPRLQWSSLDTIYFGSQFNLAWNDVKDTKSYQIELSDSRDFKRILRRFKTTKSSYPLKKLAESMLYVRIYGLDQHGLRGIDSQVYRLLRSPDTQPPYIRLLNKRLFANKAIFTLNDQIELEGETEPGASLSYQGKPIKLDRSGHFSFTLPISQEKQAFELVAKDEAGNLNKLEIEVIKYDLDKIGAIQTSAELINNIIQVSQMPLQIYGKAYPYMNIFIEYATHKYAVNSDAEGNWAIALHDYEEAGLTLSILSPDNQQPVIVKTFDVKK